MQIVALSLILAFTLVSATYVFNQNKTAEPAVLAEVANARVADLNPFGELNIIPTYEPKKIKILDKEILVEKIGLQSDGQLDTPSVWENAGWYTKSAKTAEKGNIIIDGHYDTDWGGQAAFWGLKNLNLNDKVFLTDELGQVFTYQVTDSFYVDITDPARVEIFEETDEPTLTLVTCGGVWNQIAGTYDKRLVIKARLEN